MSRAGNLFGRPSLWRSVTFSKKLVPWSQPDEKIDRSANRFIRPEIKMMDRPDIFTYDFDFMCVFK